MADNFGVSFVPGGQGNPNNPNSQSGPGGAAPNPVQQAIQMLSLRLPHVVGANAMSPGALLNAPGAMGQPGAGLNGAAMHPLLQALLRLAGMGDMGGGTMGGNPMGGGPTGAPPMAPAGLSAPRFVAGGDQRNGDVIGSQPMPVPSNAPPVNYPSAPNPGPSPLPLPHDWPGTPNLGGVAPLGGSGQSDQNANGWPNNGWPHGGPLTRAY